MQRKAYHPRLDIVQSVGEKVRSVVLEKMRCAILQMVHQLFEEEVSALCGPRFSHKGDRHCRRGGSDPSSLFLQGQRVRIKKPRVRKDNQEVELATHRALRSYDPLCDRVMKHMLAGVSSRDYESPLKNLIF